jgi:hypothetical protein
MTTVHLLSFKLHDNVCELNGLQLRMEQSITDSKIGWIYIVSHIRDPAPKHLNSTASSQEVSLAVT